MAGIETWVRVRFGWAANPTQALSGVTWTDETARMRSVSIKRGRSTWPGPWPPGTCTITLDNSTGVLDLSDATYGSRLRPGRAVIVEGKDSGGTWRPLFTGHTRARGPYEHRDTYNRSTLTVHAVDITGALAQYTIVSMTPSGELGGTWITDALTASGWSSIDKAIDAGVAELVTTAQAPNGSLMAFLAKIAASDGGEVYALKDGTLNFDDRHAVTTVARLNTSQATISDDSAAGTVAALVAPGVARTFGDRLATQVTVTTAAGDVVEATGSGGVGWTGSAYQVSSTFLANTDEGADLATWWLAHCNVVDSAPKAASVLVATTQQIVDADHQDFACNRELRDRITFEHTVPGLSQEAHALTIESIGHDIDASGWRMSLGFLSAAYVDATGYSDWLLIGNATKGQADQEKAGY